MKAVIESLLKDFELYHTEFQIRNFIIGTAGDAWAQYKQCLREISSRYETYLQGKAQIQALEREVERIARRRFGYKKIKLALVDRKSRELDTLREKHRHLLRELRIFIDAATTIKREASFDGLSKEKKMHLEALSWLVKAKRMAALDLIAFGNFSRSTVDFIFSLPKDQRRELLAYLKPENRDKMIEWAINK